MVWADWFWLIMAILVLAAVIVQIVFDRKRDKHTAE